MLGSPSVVTTPAIPELLLGDANLAPLSSRAETTALDTGDPGNGNACSRNWETAAEGYSCQPGFSDFTPTFMGGIHPRSKRVISQRLAKAARALVYKDDDTAWTGPVLVGCTLEPAPSDTPVDPKHALPIPGPRLRLDFNKTLLGPTDAVSVRVSGWELSLPHGPPDSYTPYPMSLGARGQPFADLAAAGLLTQQLLQVLTATWRPGAPGKAHNLLYTSPLEIRYGGSTTNLSDGGVWLSARLVNQCYDRSPDTSSHAPMCGWNRTTGARLPNWNSALAALPLGALNVTEITAVRYGWGEDPCCPGADRTVSPCPPGSCPINGFNSTLPAVPFLARVRNGKCDWNSIVDSPLSTGN